MLSKIFSSIIHRNVLVPRFAVPQISRNFIGKSLDDDEVFKENSVSLLDTYPSKENVVKFLRKTFNCSEDRAKVMYLQEKQRVKAVTVNQISKQIQNLLEEGITKESMMEFPFIITMNSRKLKHKLEMMRDLKLRSMNDVVPFLEFSTSKLVRLRTYLADEVAPGLNRVYYFADQFNIPPQVVAKAFASNDFLFHISPPLFVEKIHTIQQQKLLINNVLRDPSIFAYSTEKNRRHLTKAREAKTRKLMPWMTIYPMADLEKSLTFTVNQREALDGCKDQVEYIAKRLELDDETMQSIQRRLPFVCKTRPMKIKNMLDYLLEEEGFTKMDVANCIRIFGSSLSTLKQRMQELRTHGIRPTSVNTLRMGTKNYARYIRKILNRRRQLES